MNNIAFITGITGQDGSYLAKHLLSLNYIVHAIIRRSSTIVTERINDVFSHKNLYLHYGDLLDDSAIYQLIMKIKPTELYNLAAQSHVKISFEIPKYTSLVDGIGVIPILEAIKDLHDINHQCRMYQAGTSEMFGGHSSEIYTKESPYLPVSPYAAAKVFADSMCKIYRQSYNLYIVCGVLFNHTSPMRGHNFVEQKIVKAAVKISKKQQECLYLGNIYSTRDIGYAKEYMQAVHKMLQCDAPDDYILATGQSYSIKQIVNMTFKKLNISLSWYNENTINEYAVDQNNNIVVKIDKQYYRPIEVDNLLGDASYTIDKLKLKPFMDLSSILDLMIEHELRL